MPRIDQKIIDRYFKGDRAKYVASMQDCLAKHAEKTKSDVGPARAKANIELAKIQAEIQDNQ